MVVLLLWLRLFMARSGGAGHGAPAHVLPPHNSPCQSNPAKEPKHRHPVGVVHECFAHVKCKDGSCMHFVCVCDLRRSSKEEGGRRKELEEISSSKLHTHARKYRQARTPTLTRPHPHTGTLTLIHTHTRTHTHTCTHLHTGGACGLTNKATGVHSANVARSLVSIRGGKDLVDGRKGKALSQPKNDAKRDEQWHANLCRLWGQQRGQAPHHGCPEQNPPSSQARREQ